MSAPLAVVPDEQQAAVARRLRFRDAVTGLASRSQSSDLLRWVLVPGALGVILGLNFMIFGWIGAARTAREIEQIPYLISGGLIGLSFVFLGGLLLASAFWMVLLKKLQDEAEERARQHDEALELRLAQLLPAAAVNGTTAATAAKPRTARKPRTVSSTDG